MVFKSYNGWHFFFIFLVILIIVTLYFLLRNKSQKTQKIVFGSILLICFISHFSKFLFYPFKDFTVDGKYELFFVSLCTANKLIFPIFFFSKKDSLKDYMFYAGILGGGGALLFPIFIQEMSLTNFALWDYFFYHSVSIIVPVVMVLTGYHKLDYRRAYKFPIVLFFVLAFIMINSVIEVEIGLIAPRNEGVLAERYRNYALVWSPTYGPLGNAIDVLTPKFLKTVPFGEYAGQKKYWPLLYLIPTLILVGPPLTFLMSLPFDYKHFYLDAKNLIELIKIKIGKKTVSKDQDTIE